jgi:hypothetical protein
MPSGDSGHLLVSSCCMSQEPPSATDLVPVGAPAYLLRFAYRFALQFSAPRYARALCPPQRLRYRQRSRAQSRLFHRSGYATVALHY